jgi:hypothetical protein
MAAKVVTEKYVHAAQVAFPGAAEPAEARIFANVTGDPIPDPPLPTLRPAPKPATCRVFLSSPG